MVNFLAKLLMLIWVCLVYFFMYLPLSGCSATLYESPRTARNLRYKTTVSLNFTKDGTPLLLVTRIWD